MLIDKVVVNQIIEDLIYLFNALEHNDLESEDTEVAINKTVAMRDKLFCMCNKAHGNDIRVCPSCKKHIFIRWDGLIKHK